MWIAAGQPGKAALDLDKALAMPGLEAEQRGEALLDRARAAEAQNDSQDRARQAHRGRGDASPTTPSTGTSRPRSRSAKATPRPPKSAIGQALTLAPGRPDHPVRGRPCRPFRRRRRQGARLLAARRRARPGGPIGKAARDALAMLPAPLTVKQPKPLSRRISRGRSRSSLRRAPSGTACCRPTSRNRRNPRRRARRPRNSPGWRS